MATKKAKLKNSSGDYIIPYVPVDSELSSTSENPVQNKVVNTALSGKQATLVSGTNIKTVGGTSLLGSGNVAFPTVDQTYSASSTNAQSGVAVASAIGNGSVTINQGGTPRGTFTMNQSSNLTIDLDGTSGVSAIAILNKNTASPYQTLGVWQGTEYQWSHDLKTWYNWKTVETATWSNGGTIPSSGYTWKIMAYGNGRFLALKAEMFSNYKKLAYSDDGINWTESSLPSKRTWRTVCYGDGKFVAFSTETFAYSTDGINWTEAGLSAQNTWISVSYGNNKFVAIDTGYKNTTIAYSNNGIDWATLTLESAYNLYTICYGDGKFVALPNDGTIGIYSTDGINWTEFTLPIENTWTNLVYGNNKFLAKKEASSSYIYSTDGINWTQRNLPSGDWYNIAYGNGKFVVVGNNSGKSVYSTDGINWIESLMPSTNYFWRTVCYGDGKFVSVDGYEKSAYFSITYTKCYTDTANPTTSSTVYSEPNVTSSYTISSVTSGAITLSNNNTYYYNQSGNAYTYDTIGNSHPEYLCFIDGVGVKIGNTMIAGNTPITTSITSTSTDAEVPSAKAVYDEIGDVETALNTLNSGS